MPYWDSLIYYGNLTLIFVSFPTHNLCKLLVMETPHPVMKSHAAWPCLFSETHYHLLKPFVKNKELSFVVNVFLIHFVKLESQILRSYLNQS